MKKIIGCVLMFLGVLFFLSSLRTRNPFNEKMILYQQNKKEEVWLAQIRDDLWYNPLSEIVYIYEGTELKSPYWGPNNRLCKYAENVDLIYEEPIHHFTPDDEGEPIEELLDELFSKYSTIRYVKGD